MFSCVAALIIGCLYAQGQSGNTVSITTQATMTDGEAYYTTFSSEYALDFSSVSDNVRAYIITKIETKRTEHLYNLEIVEWSLDALSVKAVQRVPANTGILIKTRMPGTYKIPVTYASVPAVSSDLFAVGTNDMDAADVLNTPELDSSGDLDQWRQYYVPYVLDIRDGKLAFYSVRSTITGKDEEYLTEVFATGEETLKHNTAYLTLDYFQTLNHETTSTDTHGNKIAKVTFDAPGTFDDDPEFITTDVTIPSTITDGFTYYSTYYNKNLDLDFTDISGLSAYIVKTDSTTYYPYGKDNPDFGQRVVSRITLTKVNRVPAATPVVLRTSRPDTFTVPQVDANTRLDDVSGNVLKAVADDTDMADMLNAADPVYPYLLKSTTSYAGFGADLPDSTLAGYAAGQKILAGNTVYLPMSKTSHQYVMLCSGRYMRFDMELVLRSEDPDSIVMPTVAITVNQQSLKGTGYYGTYYSGDATLDFSSSDSITALIVTAESTKFYPNAEKGDSSVVVDVIGRVDLQQVGVIQPHTPFVVFAQTPGTYTVSHARPGTRPYDLSANVLLYADDDLDATAMAERYDPVYLYTLQFNRNLPGFNFCEVNAETNSRVVKAGDVYIMLGLNDHTFVQKSEQQYMPFGVTLTLPPVEKPDTTATDTTHTDTIPTIEKTKIAIKGTVADERGNYATFYSPDKTLDFSSVKGASAYIVSATTAQPIDPADVRRQAGSEGTPADIITRIDLKAVSRVPKATPIVVVSDMPGQIEVPEVADGTPLDSMEGNVLLAVSDEEPVGNIYILSSSDGAAGFGLYPAYEPLGRGTVYMLLSDSAHLYVMKSLQRALPFGVELQSSGITTVTADNAAATAVYRLSGQQATTMGKGINIIRSADGRTRKVLTK